MANCIGKDCERQSKARNMCMKHWMRFKKHGDTEIVYRRIKHGQTNTPEYFAWLAIKQRCYNPNIKSYKNYGAKGVKMCERWKDSYQNFYDDMGSRPSSKHSIDRIDTHGSYEPSNCRWATVQVQSANKRSRGKIDYIGVHPKRDKFVAQIAGIHIGTYEDMMVAAWTYDQWAEQIYGKDIKTNFEYI